MEEAENKLLPCGKLHICENIWLVDERLPLVSNECLTTGWWGVMKSIQGTGIPEPSCWSLLSCTTICALNLP
jgi:hypothetical protein